MKAYYVTLIVWGWSKVNYFVAAATKKEAQIKAKNNACKDYNTTDVKFYKVENA